MAGYDRENPPPWWLIHLGEMLAAFVMLVLGGMLAFIVYTEREERKEREVKYKRSKKDLDSDDDDESSVSAEASSSRSAARRRRDAGSKTNPH